MKLIRSLLDKVHPLFAKGGKLERLHPLYEAQDTFLFTPGTSTAGAPHVRDLVDLKRMMITVAVALIPCVIMALYNTGYQIALAAEAIGQTTIEGWRGCVLEYLGIAVSSKSLLHNVVLGALHFLPLYIVTLAAGGLWETVFALVRRHPISEGFLVTSLLFPLTLPPDLPFWQAAVGITFGVVIGKEVFGGVGMNILNPALTGRVFLYFAYPAEISGNAVWVGLDGYTRATPLGDLANGVAEHGVTWWQAFIGLMPGSMGETSVLACLIGAAILILTKVGSWRIMVGLVAGMCATSLLLNLIGSDSNLLFGVNPLWHLVLGGFAFGTVYMATDPVSAAHTRPGQWWYGGLVGFLTVMVRVINPAFPEGIMLAILFGNVFAPAIDKIFVNRNIKRRQLRHVAG